MHKIYYLIYSLVSVPILILTDSCSVNDVKTYARLVDESTGLSVSATVNIKTTNGLNIEIEGEHPHVNYLDERWCYVDSSFTFDSKPNEEVTIKIRHGFETLPVDTTFLLDRSNDKIDLKFRLKRWIDMREHGYLSGDTHVHLLSPETALLQMRSEDLNVVNILTSDFTSDKELFTGKLDMRSTNHHSIYVGQEIRDWDMGHICLLNLDHIIDPIDRYGGRENPNVLLTPRIQEAHAHNATVTWAHFTNLPGSESPIAIILGHIDAIDLITYNDPTGLPSHTGPWKYSGMDPAEFTIMTGVDLYYQYLNAGIEIPLAAGSDKMAEDIPVGCNRLYAPIIGKLTYDNWIKALKAGTGFITNGPILTFEALGHKAGDKIEFEIEQEVTLHATAKSLLHFNTLEVVVNGRPIAIENSQHSKTDGLYYSDINVSVKLDKSSWIAVRAISDQEYNSRILPRGMRVFAHSNPIYFHKEGAKVYVQSSVNYLIKYISSVRNWANAVANFSTQKDRDLFLNLLEDAENVILSKD